MVMLDEWKRGILGGHASCAGPLTWLRAMRPGGQLAYQVLSDFLATVSPYCAAGGIARSDLVHPQPFFAAVLVSVSFVFHSFPWRPVFQALYLSSFA